MRDLRAEITENSLINEEGRIYSLVLAYPGIADGCAPGRFYELRVGGESGRFVLRRPFSGVGPSNVAIRVPLLLSRRLTTTENLSPAATSILFFR